MARISRNCWKKTYFICLTMVLFPDSPAPGGTKIEKRLNCISSQFPMLFVWHQIQINTRSHLLHLHSHRFVQNAKIALPKKILGGLSSIILHFVLRTWCPRIGREISVTSPNPQEIKERLEDFGCEQ